MADVEARFDLMEAEIAEVMGVVNAAAGRLVDLVAKAIGEGTWNGWGIHSPAQWLAWQAGISRAHADKIVRLAERSGELPVTVAALRAGTLTLDTAAIIARRVPAAFDEAVAAQAADFTVAQLARTVGRYCFDADRTDPAATDGPVNGGADAEGGVPGAGDAGGGDPDEAGATDGPVNGGPGAEGGAGGAGDAGVGGSDGAPATGAGEGNGDRGGGGDRVGDSDAGAGDSDGGDGVGSHAPVDLLGRREPVEGLDVGRVTMGSDEQGWWIKGRFPADEGAVIEQAIRAARDDRFRLLDHGRPADTAAPKVSLADGLLAVAEASLAAGAAAHPGADRYLVHVHLNVTPTADDPTGRASLHLGGTLPPSLAEHLTCGDLTMRPIYESHGIALSVGRVTREIGIRLRRQIEHRDGGCVVPGCGRTWGLEIHHIWHWEHGGPTDTHNLTTLCRAHHRAHHHNWLGISGNADRPPGHPEGLQFTDPFGRTMPPRGTPKPPPAAPTVTASAAAIGINAPAGTFKHPLGERLDYSAVAFQPKKPHPEADGPLHPDDGQAAQVGAEVGRRHLDPNASRAVGEFTQSGEGLDPTQVPDSDPDDPPAVRTSAA